MKTKIRIPVISRITRLKKTLKQRVKMKEILRLMKRRKVQISHQINLFPQIKMEILTTEINLQNLMQNYYRVMMIL